MSRGAAYHHEVRHELIGALDGLHGDGIAVVILGEDDDAAPHGEDGNEVDGRNVPVKCPAVIINCDH